MDNRVSASQATTTDTPREVTPLRQLPPAEVRGARSGIRSRLELRGPAGARRRGALLRRLIALADWLALGLALAIGMATGLDSDTLAWALIFSPTWILVLKLHGLYDHDHRRIRHSTLDELPTLVSASALGMLALNGLLSISPAGAMEASSAVPIAATAFAASLGLRAG